ncbi:hypothetical protein LINPERPRIM_LOCUS22839 [Linum perenne]
MWWMMGENGGHYCSKKTDDICADVCGQVRLDWLFCDFDFPGLRKGVEHVKNQVHSAGSGLKDLAVLLHPRTDLCIWDLLTRPEDLLLPAAAMGVTTERVQRDTALLQRERDDGELVQAPWMDDSRIS